MSDKNIKTTKDNKETKTLSPEAKVQENINKKKKAAKKKKIINRSIIAVIVIAAVYIFGTKQASGYYPWQDADAIAAANVVAPEELTVQNLIYSTTVDISGELEPLETQEVISKSDATVTAVYVTEGDRVNAGDLLATLDDSDIQYQISKLQAEIKESKLKGTSSDVELLQMELASYESDLADTKLYASIDGIVTEVNIDVDDYAETQDSCITIIDPSKLVAEVEIDEIDLRYITTDSIAKITYDSAPGVISDAYISYMPYAGYLSNEGIGVKTVEFTIDNPPENVYPGYSFEGTISGQTEEEILIVSEDAVKTDSDGYSYVMKSNDDGTSEKTIVTTDYLTEGYVEIMTGDVTEGDILLVYPSKSSSSDDEESSSLLSGNLLGGSAPQAPGPGNGTGPGRRD
jgi:multidrug efflux pump subunit AcrA (membrane-fusion protein)